VVSILREVWDAGFGGFVGKFGLVVGFLGGSCSGKRKKSQWSAGSGLCGMFGLLKS